MQVSIRSLLVAVIALIAPAIASADFYSQINGFGVTTTYSGHTSARSQYDTTPVVNAPLLREMTTAYDNFTLTNTGQVDQLQWTGAYAGAAGLHASDFRIAFYQDNAGTVGSQIGSTIIAPVGTVAETANGGNHFSYTYTPGSPLVFNGGTKYWMSVVAGLDYGDDGLPTPTTNEWGWAFNNTGDLNSYQADQQGPESGGFFTYVTFNDPVDYSFRLTTTVVPEPSSCLLLAGAVGGIAVRKWRNRRKASA